MALTFSPPKIITDALILYLDAGNPKSYINSATTITNLLFSDSLVLYNNPSFINENFGVLDFDGVDDYIGNGVYPNPLPNNDRYLFQNTDSFSFSIWFKLDVFSGSQTPLLGIGNNSVRLGYFITTVNSSQKSNKIRFNIVSGIFTTVTGQFLIDSFDTINLNEWVNVICTYDGSQNINGAKVYINGVDNGATRTSTGTGLTDDISYPTLPLKVFRGRGTDVGNGKVSNVSLYNKELSQSEILQNYNALKYRFI